MKRYIQYFKYVIRHKWFVFVAGLKLNVPIWQLLLHDWDKFAPYQFIPFAKCYRAASGEKQYNPDDTYWAAVNAHHKNNKHHWEHWIFVNKTSNVPLLIPEKHCREMVADWIGAGLAQEKPDTLLWYDNNRDKMLLHEASRKRVGQLLEEYYNGR